MNTAQTILRQLGGNRFLAMTGASNLLSDDKRGRGSLTMKLPGRREVTHVRITLNAADLYDVEGIHVGRSKGSLVCAPIQSEEGVYAENLRASFERLTGLATSL